MSDGLSVSLFNREGREVAFGLDVVVIRVNVPKTGQTVEGPIVVEAVGGKLTVQTPDDPDCTCVFDLPVNAGSRVSWTFCPPNGKYGGMPVVVSAGVNPHTPDGKKP